MSAKQLHEKHPSLGMHLLKLAKICQLKGLKVNVHQQVLFSYAQKYQSLQTRFRSVTIRMGKCYPMLP